MPDVTVHVSQADTNINFIAHDGTGYTTLALLYAAGKYPFPCLDPSNPSINPGMYPKALLARTENGSGADGGNAYIAFNISTIPASSATMSLIDGAGGQTYVKEGVTQRSIEMIRTIALKKIVGADHVILTAVY